MDSTGGGSLSSPLPLPDSARVTGAPGGEVPLSHETLTFEKDPCKNHIKTHFNTQNLANGCRGVLFFVNLT